MTKKPLLICLILMCLAVTWISAQDNSVSPQYMQHYNRGKEFLSLSRYNDAIREFERSAENSPAHFKPAVYSMTAQCYLALENYEKAESIFDYIISTYPESEEYLESLYHKGRIDFINGKYETSIEKMNSFIDSSKTHPLEGNAFFWIAESLYRLGHEEEALSVYEIVIKKYRDSYKYEAALYRTELISLGRREKELVKLLKLSHEEALRERDEYAKREKEYDQAILSYQRKLADISDEDASALVSSLRETNTVLRKQLELQEEIIKNLTNELETVKKTTGSNNTTGESKTTSTGSQ